MKFLFVKVVGCLVFILSVSIGFTGLIHADAGAVAADGKIRYKCPDTPKGTQVDDYFGTRVADPYRWLENIDTSETAAWIEAQNTFTDSVYNAPGLKELRAHIHNRLKTLFSYNRIDPPLKVGDYYVYGEQDGSNEQPVILRRKGLNGTPQVLIDPNTFSSDGSVILRDYFFSRDQKYVCCRISRGGADWNEFFVMETETGKRLKDHVKWAKYSDALWFEDGFFYSRYPDPGDAGKMKAQNMAHKLYYHKLGTNQSEDKVILEDKANPRLLFFGNLTPCGRFLTVTGYMGPSVNLLYSVNLQKKEPIKTLINKPIGKFSVVGANDDGLLVHTNYQAPNFRLILIDPEHPQVEHWREVLPQTSLKMEAVFFVGGRLIVTYLRDACTVVSVYTLAGAKLHDIALPGIGTVLQFTGPHDGNEAFYTYSSYTTPPTTFRYLLKENKSEIFQKPKVAFDPDLYTTRLEFFKSKDGTRIPLFLVHKKGLKIDGNRPVILSGYGGYGVPMRPFFSLNTLANLPLLERDGIYAVACLRGGGEYGEEWHQAGMFEKKQNVFDDFIAAAEYLIGQGVTTPKRLGIYSASNGGLLIGAVLNQRPELFGAAAIGVPILDMLRFQKFTIGWTAAAEYGSSDKEEQFNYLYKYSPLHNIKCGLPYPPVLVSTGDRDDRAFPAHAYKYVAQMQARCDSPNNSLNPIVLRVYKEVGHAGSSATKQMEYFVDLISFLIYNLNADPATPLNVPSSTSSPN